MATNPPTPKGEDVPYKVTRGRGSKSGLSSAAVVGLDLDELGTAEVVTIDDLNVDPAYQREMRWEFVNTIAKAYDIVKAGPILVSERKNGDMYVVDGQHRMAGAQQAGETEMFAHVVHGLTREKEAELRLARNDRKSDTMQERFRSRLVMGDPIAKAIVGIVERNGTKVNLSATIHGGINAINTLEVLYEVDHGATLDTTLKFMQDLKPDEPIDSQRASTSTLKAYTWFIAQHIDTREIPRAAAIERFSQHDPDDLRRKAIAHKAALGGGLWINTYRALVELWNFRRTEANQLKWKTIGSIQRLGDQSTPKAARDKLKNMQERYSDGQH